ncbi:MAG: amino acid transporter [Aggregatilineales bacterium]
MPHPTIPYDNWQPLSLEETITLFQDVPFAWCIAGGYVLELFAGKAYRAHDDMDVVIYRDEQLAAQAWLSEWHLYAADPPGTLRTWQPGEYLPVGVHDIWGYQSGVNQWQFQFMIAEVNNGNWVSRHHPEIRFARDTLINIYNNIPCIRSEVQLLYKSRNRRPKDEVDFDVCVPLLSTHQKKWLRQNIQKLFPEGHPWLSRI